MMTRTDRMWFPLRAILPNGKSCHHKASVGSLSTGPMDLRSIMRSQTSDSLSSLRTTPSLWMKSLRLSAPCLCVIRRGGDSRPEELFAKMASGECHRQLIAQLHHLDSNVREAFLKTLLRLPYHLPRLNPKGVASGGWCPCSA